jgi:hypothetical protein
MPHPAQIRDAVQVYIERQYHPVRTWHIQDEITNRLDTRHALVYTALMQLEQEGKVCKHVSPESGARVLVFAKQRDVLRYLRAAGPAGSPYAA